MVARLFSVAVLMLLSFSVRAEQVALNFGSIPLPAFVKATYRDMLHRDFVMSPELLAQDRPISVSIRSIESDKLPAFVDSVLSQQGVRSVFKDGVWELSLEAQHQPVQTNAFAAAGSSSSFSADLFGPGGSARLPGSDAAPAPAPVGEQVVYKPINRKADFLVTVVNSVFGSKPAVAAGGMIVFSAPQEQLDKIVKLCEQLDNAAPQVRLAATFVEVSRNESSNLGVAVIADVLGATLGVKVGDTSSGALTLRAKNFQAVIDALAADGRFKQVAAPTAVVDDNEKSQVSFGESVPTIASTSLDRNGTPVQQVNYQQSGVLLSVQPSVLGSGRINVVIDGQVSSFSQTTTGVNGSPTLNKRQVQTAVTVQDGELLMIGGLNDSRDVAASSGLSFLPKSWRGRSSSSANTDLVLILAASVVRQGQGVGAARSPKGEDSAP